MQITAFAGGFARVGGVESFLCALLPAMVSRGIECRLCCWDGMAPRHHPRLRELECSGVQVRRVGWRWGCRWGWPDKLLRARLRREIAEADLVLLPKPLPFPVAGALITPYRPAEMWRKGVKAELLDSFRAIAVQAETFREDLRAFGYRGPITALPYIPPALRPPMDTPAGPLRIGFLGRLVEDKNPGYLVRVLRAVLPREPGARLCLFGDGPLRGDLERQARGLPVEFHGMVQPPDVAAAIDSCHIFAFASRTEGQCLAALEILARGRPVVATPVGAFPEMLADGALGEIAADDAEAFAEAILRARGRSPHDLQRAFAAKFDREAIIDQYAAWCSRLAS